MRPPVDRRLWLPGHVHVRWVSDHTGRWGCLAQVYRFLVKRSSCVQPISCDEAFVDITGLGSPDRIVAELRAEIEGATGITASAGIGPNMLLARLATKRAKPNGQFNINPSQVRPRDVTR